MAQSEKFFYGHPLFAAHEEVLDPVQEVAAHALSSQLLVETSMRHTDKGLLKIQVSVHISSVTRSWVLQDLPGKNHVEHHKNSHVSKQIPP